ncbi:hypothetical protein BT63DRAFT_450350 [Microthyrium microscopicum]|uniref:Methyltransferase n=1 Tax=Microthyrium microscopicum TaxID=703497 RepID=A0A6A6UTB2_9PEZI|nr:hypothetical protein BT63DRAFT_450350 [Microthyrium microscopicum]
MPLDKIASIPYIEDDAIYQEQKAYAIAFELDGVPVEDHSNHKINNQQVVVHDLRGASSTPQLESSGFQFVQSDLRHTFRELDARERSPRYPAKTGYKAKFAQPSTVPHVDYTPNSTRARLRQITDEAEFEPLKDAPVWRVLKGPNHDWPLAVCDFASIHPEKDPLESDLVFRDAVSENVVLRHNPSHSWYYLSGQRTNEVLVFRNATSPGRSASKAFHASFGTQEIVESEKELRQSIEVRLFAFL